MDVLCNMSGIFRDSFQNVVELLDDLFKRAAEAPDSPDMNFIRFACCSCQKTKKKNYAAYAVALCMGTSVSYGG